jgi:hypothetical protein
MLTRKPITSCFRGSHRNPLDARFPCISPTRPPFPFVTSTV